MRVVSLRPLSCLILAAVGISACSDANSGAQASSYQSWAEKVATIPLTPIDDGDGKPTASPLPLFENPDAKPANKPLRVELMSPHQLWDLRDGPLKIPTIEVAEGTTTAVVVSSQSPPGEPVVTTAPAANRETAPAPTSNFRTVQLGAYGNEDSAREAWNRLASGSASEALKGLVPQFEPVDVNGRNLVRLRVSAREDRVQTLCESIASNDPWCARSARSMPPSTMFH